jgi:hypothetical protein
VYKRFHVPAGGWSVEEAGMKARAVEAARCAAAYEVGEPRAGEARGPCCPICQGAMVPAGMALRCVRCGFQWCAGCGADL